MTEKDVGVKASYGVEPETWAAIQRIKDDAILLMQLGRHSAIQQSPDLELLDNRKAIILSPEQRSLIHSNPPVHMPLVLRTPEGRFQSIADSTDSENMLPLSAYLKSWLQFKSLQNTNAGFILTTLWFNLGLEYEAGELEHTSNQLIRLVDRLWECRWIRGAYLCGFIRFRAALLSQDQSSSISGEELAQEVFHEYRVATIESANLDEWLQRLYSLIPKVIHAGLLGRGSTEQDWDKLDRKLDEIQADTLGNVLCTVKDAARCRAPWSSIYKYEKELSSDSRALRQRLKYLCHARGHFPQCWLKCALSIIDQESNDLQGLDNFDPRAALALWINTENPIGDVDFFSWLEDPAAAMSRLRNKPDPFIDELGDAFLDNLSFISLFSRGRRYHEAINVMDQMMSRNA